MNSMTQTTFFPDWSDLIVFSDSGPQPHFLAKTGGFTVLVAGLVAGQKIPPHPEALAVYHFLEGTGWMIVEDRRLAVKPGAIIVVPEGASRGMEAETKLSFFATKAG